jgi:hypothetical protein
VFPSRVSAISFKAADRDKNYRIFVYEGIEQIGIKPGRLGGVTRYSAQVPAGAECAGLHPFECGRKCQLGQGEAVDKGVVFDVAYTFLQDNRL